MGFSLFNIPVLIQPTFWIFLLLFSYDPGGVVPKMCVLATVFMGSLLFHELGHGLAAKKFGCSPKITLESFGGYTSYSSRGLSDWQQCMITLAGPLFTALLIGLSRYLLKMHVFQEVWLVSFLYYTMQLNIYWLIVNLAPLEPLDGGKIAAYLLRRVFGEERGEWARLALGNVTAVCGAAYFFITGSYVFAWIFLFYGFQNLQQWQKVYRKKSVSSFSQYQEAIRLAEEGDREKARDLLEKLSKSKDPYIRNHSTESLIQLLEENGKQKEAFSLLKTCQVEELAKGKWLLCKLAYFEKNYELIAKHAREIYELHPTFETALLNAKVFAHLKDPSYSAGWLQTALQFPERETLSLEMILADSAFDSVKGQPAFEDALSQKTLS